MRIDGQSTLFEKRGDDTKNRISGIQTEIKSEKNIDHDTLPRTMLTSSEERFLHALEKEGKVNIPGVRYDLPDPEEPNFRLPADQTKGKFLGIRGESAFVPEDIDAQRKLAEYGRTSVEYKGQEPDFTPFSRHKSPWGEIDFVVKIGHMTSNRYNGKFEYGRRPKGTKFDPMYEPGNFAQADLELANDLSNDERTITPQEIEKYRIDNHLVWHECADCMTMMLVPEEIHMHCPHTGGTSYSGYLVEWGDVERDFDGFCGKKTKNTKRNIRRKTMNGIKLKSHLELTRELEPVKDKIQSQKEGCQQTYGELMKLEKDQKEIMDSKVPGPDKEEALKSVKAQLHDKREQLKEEVTELKELIEKKKKIADQMAEVGEASQSTAQRLSDTDAKAILSGKATTIQSQVGQIQTGIESDSAFAQNLEKKIQEEE